LYRANKLTIKTIATLNSNNGFMIHLALGMKRILKLLSTEKKFLCLSLIIMISLVGAFTALSNLCSYLDIHILNSEQQISLFSPIEIKRAFANHGKEVSLELNSATFSPLTSALGNQVKVGVNYTTTNSTLVGNTINAVMKVYTPNTTAIKSTSFPNGFTANRSGMEEIKTTIRGNSTQNVIAVVQFTDLSKTLPISNPIQVDLNLTRDSEQASSPEEEPAYEIAALPP
jgi:hypothetical protein